MNMRCYICKLEFGVDDAVMHIRRKKYGHAKHVLSKAPANYQRWRVVGGPKSE